MFATSAAKRMTPCTALLNLTLRWPLAFRSPLSAVVPQAGFGPSADRHRHGDEAGGKPERHGRCEADRFADPSGRYGDRRPSADEARRKRHRPDAAPDDRRHRPRGDRRARPDVRRRSPSVARSRERDTSSLVGNSDDSPAGSRLRSRAPRRFPRRPVPPRRLLRQAWPATPRFC